MSTIQRIESSRTMRALETRSSVSFTSQSRHTSAEAKTSNRNVASGNFPGGSCSIVTGIHATRSNSGIAERGMTIGSRRSNSCGPNTSAGRIQTKPWIPIRNASGMPAQIAVIGHSGRSHVRAGRGSNSARRTIGAASRWSTAASASRSRS